MQRTDVPVAAEAPPPPPRRTLSDRLLGAVGVAAILAALVFFFVGEEDTGGAAEEAVPPAPAVALHRPAGGDTVSGAVPVEFHTPAAMREGPSGWVAEGYYHLHALVDGAELMARPGEVVPLGGGRYRWVLPPLPPGEHRIRLRWSGPDHRLLAEGGSPEVRVVAR